jgi:hypothetical protein
MATRSQNIQAQFEMLMAKLLTVTGEQGAKAKKPGDYDI